MPDAVPSRAVSSFMMGLGHTAEKMKKSSKKTTPRGVEEKGELVVVVVNHFRM